MIYFEYLLRYLPKIQYYIIGDTMKENDVGQLIDALSNRELIIRVDLNKSLKISKYRVGALEMKGELGISFRDIKEEGETEEKEKVEEKELEEKIKEIGKEVEEPKEESKIVEVESI